MNRELRTANPSSILIIEDYIPLHVTLRVLLHHWGWTDDQLTFVSSALEAIELLATRRFDTVICDQHLDNGRLNGDELYAMHCATYEGRWIIHTSDPFSVRRSDGLIVVEKGSHSDLHAALRLASSQEDAEDFAESQLTDAARTGRECLEELAK